MKVTMSSRGSRKQGSSGGGRCGSKDGRGGWATLEGAETITPDLHASKVSKAKKDCEGCDWQRRKEEGSDSREWLVMAAGGGRRQEASNGWEEKKGSTGSDEGCDRWKKRQRGSSDHWLCIAKGWPTTVVGRHRRKATPWGATKERAVGSDERDWCGQRGKEGRARQRPTDEVVGDSD
ncbi:hypothetical protein B296_00058642 [Ensete ventricosum]|uniref:Uncharacterized protein n=1 Tax=Ensete ventricosum TaxID=4639 RepID=A0A426XLB1_ENSVE|nr:hypothetical protein B296_00058642 [Ensete ventricosum]